MVLEKQFCSSEERVSEERVTAFGLGSFAEACRKMLLTTEKKEIRIQDLLEGLLLNWGSVSPFRKRREVNQYIGGLHLHRI
jgi:hypothetical protein